MILWMKAYGILYSAIISSSDGHNQNANNSTGKRGKNEYGVGGGGFFKEPPLSSSSKYDNMNDSENTK